MCPDKLDQWSSLWHQNQTHEKTNRHLSCPIPFVDRMAEEFQFWVQSFSLWMKLKKPHNMHYFIAKWPCHRTIGFEGGFVGSKVNNRANFLWSLVESIWWALGNMHHCNLIFSSFHFIYPFCHFLDVSKMFACFKLFPFCHLFKIVKR